MSGNNLIATLIEDNEHYDDPKTQYIHRELHRLIGKFPDMQHYARAMLDRLTTTPTSKPLCFMSRQNSQDHLDYDIAHYIMKWVPPPDGSRPTTQHRLHRLRQAVDEQPILSPYTNAHKLQPLELIYAKDQPVFGHDSQSHGQPVNTVPT